MEQGMEGALIAVEEGRNVVEGCNSVEGSNVIDEGCNPVDGDKRAEGGWGNAWAYECGDE